MFTRISGRDRNSFVLLIRNRDDLRCTEIFCPFQSAALMGNISYLTICCLVLHTVIEPVVSNWEHVIYS